jgi:hypothetical protein
MTARKVLLPVALRFEIFSFWYKTSGERSRNSWPEQLAYELIRPIVLFGFNPAEHAAQTGTSERSLRRRGQRFDGTGMASLFADAAPSEGDDRRFLPPHLRQLIVDLKAEYPAFGFREIATICYVASGRRPSPSTIRHLVADGPKPTSTSRRYPRYHESPIQPSAG